MVRQFIDSIGAGHVGFPSGLDDATLITGELFSPMLAKHAPRMRYAPPEIEVVAIENSLFGRQVTVAGLLPGGDILKAAASALSEHVFISPDCVDSQGRFIDNLTVNKLSRMTGKAVHVGFVER
jgi:NifB/MoaA-like Fe-S oxidoreductase